LDLANSFKNFFSLPINHNLFSKLSVNLELIFMLNLNQNTLLAKERR
jgi:hypothetical protein